MGEAPIADTPSGRVVESDGWFVLNAAEAAWDTMPGVGAWCGFEAAGGSERRQYGVGVHVLWPGQVNGKYHWESDQEGFLVLSGECVAIVEGQERRMRQWDYLHCPPGTEHILAGAGDGPCAIFMIGARSPEKRVRYTVSDVAARHGASVSEETGDSEEAYADSPRDVTRIAAPWPRPDD
jgi:uncharacterized cupin superfamily protein